MIAFFSSETQKLIITPFRCGSRNLIKNATNYNLIHFPIENDSGKKLFNAVVNEAKEKIFIYRDPVDRYLSFYHTFVFKNTDKEKRKETAKHVTPKSRSKNFWEDVYTSLYLLEENYDKDSHTDLQSRYFSMMGEDIDEYEIIDVEDYAKFIYLNFADKVEKHTSSLEDEPFNYYSYRYYNKIVPRLEKLYNADLDLKKLICNL